MKGTQGSGCRMASHSMDRLLIQCRFLIWSKWKTVPEVGVQSIDKFNIFLE